MTTRKRIVLRSGHTRFADRFDVPMIGAATSAKDRQPGQALAQLAVLPAEFLRIACVEFGCRIEFRVTLPGRVGSKPTHPAGPGGPA